MLSVYLLYLLFAYYQAVWGMGVTDLVNKMVRRQALFLGYLCCLLETYEGKWTTEYSYLTGQ